MRIESKPQGSSAALQSESSPVAVRRYRPYRVIRAKVRSMDETLLQSAHGVEKNAQKGLPSATYHTVARDGRCKELYESRRQSFLLNWVLMHLYYVLTYHGTRFGSSPGTFL